MTFTLASSTGGPLPFQPTINPSTRYCSCLLWRACELGHGGFTAGIIGIVDVQSPFIAAESGPNEELDLLIDHSTGSPPLRGATITLFAIAARDLLHEINDPVTHRPTPYPRECFD